MSPSATADRRADRVAARATGLGIGLITFMVTWTIGARITERIFATPTNAFVAMGIAVVAGALTTLRAGQRLDPGAQITPRDERPLDSA
jgi:hypothetical protein